MLLHVVGVFILGISPAEATGTADVAVAQRDADFAVQGEYVGVDRAMQVIAMGDGEFDLAIYEGGLPGAGARGEPRRIESDIDSIAGLIESMGLKRVERQSATLGQQPPAGAVVLFDGTQASVDQYWENGRLTDDGLLQEGTQTQKRFGDYRLHLEFRTPYAPSARGQKRGNSGVYHQGRYETQILDSFGLKGLNNEAGGIYTVSDPAINACFPPLRWQTYDVDFTQARYDGEGNKKSNARMTVRLNGIMVQNEVEVPSQTPAAALKDGPELGPIMLQNHGDPVRFRNIWLLPRDADREAARPIVPGFERFADTASTSLADSGELLIGSLACTACHAAEEKLLPPQRGPDLTELAGRVRPDSAVAMIANPHQTKTGTTMPDPWPGADTSTRERNAEAIASYLLLQGKGRLADRIVSESLADRGKELYQSIGCMACHGALEGDAKTPSATTVPLGDPHRKYTVPSLIHFLQNCTEIRTGLRMPKMVGTPQEFVAVAAYLTRQTTVGQSNATFTRRVYRGRWQNLPDFSQLEPVSTDDVTGLKIDDLNPPTYFAAVYEANLSIETDGEYTFALSSDDGSALEINGERLVNDGIHPTTTREATYKLKAGVSPIRVEYFDGGGQVELKLEMTDPRMGRDDITSWITDGQQGGPIDLLPSGFTPDESMVETGKQLFADSGCIHCHAFGENQTVNQSPSNQSPSNQSTAAPLDRLPSSGGCLADQPRSPAVDYALGATQVNAIVAALDRRRDGDADEATSDDDQRRIHLMFAALNCYACHERDAVGGPEPSRDSLFETTIPEMGLEGRLPPSLTGIGDKINDRYLKEVLQSGANARDYMRTRMPGFDHDQLASLVQAMVRTDRSDEMQDPAQTKSLADVQIDGRKLCGNGGLSCIKCHSYNGNNGGGLGAIDMLMMTDRLRVQWFQRYLQDPTKYRPGTRMPNSFVDGRSAVEDIEGGDPAKQIDAMWQYLLLGTQAKEPQGLNQAAIVLAATERPRIYRNFFAGVSPRGIGVGYPAELNLIWDAEQMSLARIWKNEFIDASMHWRGRGQGNQQPLGDAIVTVDSAVSIAMISDPASVWPTQSARELNYRMKGYTLDENGNPTFRYLIGDTTVEDQPLPIEGGLQRVLKIDCETSPSDRVLVWQIATGKIEPIEQGYRIDDQAVYQITGVKPELIEVDGKQTLRAVITSDSTTTATLDIRW